MFHQRLSRGDRPKPIFRSIQTARIRPRQKRNACSKDHPALGVGVNTRGRNWEDTPVRVSFSRNLSKWIMTPT